MVRQDAFAGKVVLITGASSGIGAVTAVHFYGLGAKLSLTGRNEANLLRTADECKAVLAPHSAAADGVERPILLIANSDLTKDGEAERVVDETIKKFGKLDVLINNAGMVEPGSIETTTMAQYDRTFDINVRSVYHLTMLATPHLIKSQGTIVNVSSVTGMRAFPNCLSYCMSKAAIDQFTRCVALELASKQVRVNSVNPGVIGTGLHKRGGMDEETYQKFLENCKNTHALGRYGEPEEVAASIVFLASDEASFITGANLPIDGGRHAMCPR